MKSTLSVLFLSLAFGIVSIGHAEVVSFQIAVEVETVYDPNDFLDSSIVVNDILTGVLQYDTALPDDSPNPNYGNYHSTAPEDNFVKGTNGSFGSFNTTLFLNATVIDGMSGSPDELHFFASGDTTPSLLWLVDYVDVDIDLIGTSDTVISNDGLPTNLDLNDFSSAMVYFSSDRYDDMAGGWVTDFSVAANITSITRVVPEPTSLLLTCSVLGIVGASYRRRKA